MVKYVLNAAMGMILFTVVRAEDVEYYNNTSCYDIYCKGDEKCCVSPTNGAVCCPTENICDSKLGCIENANSSSTSNVKECPPLTTECFTSKYFDLCCPLPFAECCDDLIHCCAHGYECDLQHMRCNKKNNTGIYSRLFKREASTVDLGMKHCGGKTWCPEHDECCQGKNGGWDCCHAFSKTRINRRELRGKNTIS